MPRQPYYWVWPDTHFYHDAMSTLCDRPPLHTSLIVRNCRRLIAPQDTLVHLGDVIFYRYHELPELLAQIPGRKVLVMGNHDRKSRRWYEHHGFDFVADMLVLGDVLLSHKPVENFPDGVRINVHGHLHNSGRYPQWHDPRRHRLVALELSGYEPVRLDRVVSGNWKNPCQASACPGE